MDAQAPPTAEEMVDTWRQPATKGTEMWELEYDQMHESAIQLSKMEPFSDPEGSINRGPSTNSNLEITMCTQHKICQRFVQKVEEARTSGETNSKNRESLVFTELYAQF